MPDYQESDLTYLREVVDPALAGLPAYALREQVDSAFGEGFAEAMDADLEGVFDDIGRFAKRAAPAIAHVGGGILQGAMSGSAAGLPGIIAGAAAGGVGAGLSRYGSGTARKVGQAMTGVTQLAGQFSPMGRAGGAIGSAVSGLGGLAGGRRGRPNLGQIAGQLGQVAAGAIGGRAGGGAMAQIAGLLQSPQTAGALGQLFGGGNGAGQLMSALQRPETRQALAALRLGPMGRPNIPVGPQQLPVPTGAFTQLLGHLAQQASGPAPASAASPGSGEDESIAFMDDGEGGFFGDPASAGDRAARLWDMMNDAQAERLVEALEQESFEDESWADDENAYDTDSYYDSLDLADAEAIEFALEAEARYGW